MGFVKNKINYQVLKTINSQIATLILGTPHTSNAKQQLEKQLNLE